MLQMENIFAIDRPLHNHHQDSRIEVNHFVKEMKPARNSYLFEGFIDFDIINTQVIEKINFLIQINFPLIRKCEIRTTCESWMLKYDGCIDDDIIKILIKDETLKYIQINNLLIRNENMIEKIDNHIIHYNRMSFRKSDDSIRFELYRILKREINSKYLYFIGGEMVFYKVLLNPLEYIMYTDYESIYKDSLLNGNQNTFLINYDTDKLKKVDSNYTLIANTSKSGLGVNLAKSILELDLNYIVIISCNKKSFQRDFLILKQKYFISKKFELKTNYIVDVIFLYKTI